MVRPKWRKQATEGCAIGGNALSQALPFTLSLLPGHHRASISAPTTKLYLTTGPETTDPDGCEP